MAIGVKAMVERKINSKRLLDFILFEIIHSMWLSEGKHRLQAIYG